MMRTRSGLSLVIFIGYGLFYLMCLFSVLGLWGEASWFFDLCSHFKIQYAFIALVSAILFAFVRRFLLFSVAMMICVVNISFIWPLYHLSPSSTAPVLRALPSLKVLQMNVWRKNAQVAMVKAAILKFDPDVLALEEYEGHWPLSLTNSGVLSRFPYAIRTHDIALYSKLPLYDAQIVSLGPKPRSDTILARILVQEQPVSVVVIHPRTPVTPRYYQEQRLQFENLSELASKLEKRVIIVGDFNATPWGDNFKMMLSRLHLRNSQAGFGAQPSWPSFFIFPWLPIDHCLVSEQFVTLKRQLGPFTGSDHLPLYLKLALKPEIES